MPQFAHTAGTDPLGLATAGNIVLVSASGGPVKEYVEMLAETGIYIADAAKEVKPVEMWNLEYELRADTLNVAFGALVNSQYLITAMNARCAPLAYPSVSVTAIKFSNPNKFKAPPSAPGSIAVSGGFGVTSKFGATFSQGLSSSCSVSMLTAEAMEETSGDYLQEGYCPYGFKQEVTIEAYDQITVPAGAKETSLPVRTSRDGFLIYSKSFFNYMP